MRRKQSEQNVGEFHNINIAHKSFGILAKFQYFGMTLTNNKTGNFV